MKKGFTLSEVIGVLIIMAAIALIIIPIVDKELKEGKQEIYNDAIDSIKNSMSLYITDKKIESNESITVTLYQLKQAGLIDLDVKNPNNSEMFANDMLITATNENGIITYNVDTESGCDYTEYVNLPNITLNVPVYEVIDINDEFNTDVTDVTITYNESLEPNITNNVNVSEIGTYQVIYEVEHNNIKNKVIKTVIVRDQTGPTLSFETLNIPLSQAKTYDYLSDITISDKGCSNDEINVIVETNFGALKGIYSVKYIAKDKYGNETVKYRKVITS